jgi:CheY-like chemotaxis protein
VARWAAASFSASYRRASSILRLLKPIGRNSATTPSVHFNQAPWCFSMAANLPFIMMTADPSIDKLVQAKNAGVTCFIKKPFRADELQAKILQANTSNRLVATA